MAIPSVHWLLRVIEFVYDISRHHNPLLLNAQHSGVDASSSLTSIPEEQVQRALLFALIPVVVAFIFIVFIFYRARRESYFKQREVEFKLSKCELEMKALRSQMNPHFIFNCMNSIHHYMHRKDITKASEYLIKFSQLIRQVLETSTHRMIPLEDDLQALNAYIQLEQLRMDHSFGYTIIVDPSINQEATHIPPLLIQPFVENSIWHGLSQQKAEGKIDITICQKENMLQCTIEDNGDERTEKPAFDLSNTVKKTSLGMQLIQERLDVINQLHESNASYSIADKYTEGGVKEGKRIVLLLPFED